MPHLFLEYSANVPDEPDFNPANVKSRAVPHETFPRSRAECRCDFTLEIREMRRDLYFKSADR
jgi:5-carboxymethyl-2-hydroxymuconate isomerase